MRKQWYFSLLLVITLFTASTGSYSQGVRTIDRDILESINRLNSPFINGYCNVISDSSPVLSATVPLSLFTCSLIKKDKQRTAESVYIGASIATSLLASAVIKNAFSRARPYNSHPDLIASEDNENSFSFPSGHTAASFALATSLSLKYPKWYIIAPSYFWASSVAFARMQKGVHYPSDVFGGMLVGTCSALICYEVNNWISNRYGKRIEDTSWIKYIYE
jgi:membrane-associated phospholipid phosphatase